MTNKSDNDFIEVEIFTFSKTILMPMDEKDLVRFSEVLKKSTKVGDACIPIWAYKKVWEAVSELKYLNDKINTSIKILNESLPTGVILK